MSVRSSPSRVGNIPQFDRSFGPDSELSDVQGTPSVESVWINSVFPPFATLLQVFDFRNADSLAFIQQSYLRLETEPNDIKGYLSKKYEVPKERIIFASASCRIAAIVDHVYPDENLFLLINGYQNTVQQYCLHIDKDVTVSELIDAIKKKEGQKDHEKVYLLIQRKIIQSSSQKVIALGLSNFVKCVSIKQQSLTLKCHYHVSPKVEIVNYLECFNTASVEEVKVKFCQQLGKEFPNILHQDEEIVLSWHAGILEDKDYLLQTDESRKYLFDKNICAIEDITIQIKRPDSMFIAAVYHDVKTTIVIPPTISVDDLRYCVGKHIKKDPPSLKLQINNEKITDNNISSILTNNCEIQVELSKKVAFQIRKIYLDEKGDVRNNDVVSVCMYKNDTVGALRERLAESMGERPFFLKVLYSGDEMDDNKTLRKYHIQADANVDVVVCKNRLKLWIICRGCTPQIIVVDDSCATSVLQLKTFLTHKLNIGALDMNIVFKDRPLANCDPLAKTGIRCYDRLVVCLFPHSERNNDEGIFRLITLDTLGAVRKDEAALVTKKTLCGIQGFEDIDTLPGYCKTHDQLKHSSRGIRLLCNDKQLFKMQHEQQQNIGKKTTVPQTVNEEPRANLTTEPQHPVGSELPAACVHSLNHQVAPGVAVFGRSELLHARMKCTHAELASNDRTVSVTEWKLECDCSVEDVEKLFYLVERDKMKKPEAPLAESRLALQEDPSTSELGKIITSIYMQIGVDWCRLAIALGLTQKDIERCETKHHNQLDRQVHAMFHLWIQKKGNLATTQELILGLRSAELNNIADSLDNDSSYQNN